MMWFVNSAKIFFLTPFLRIHDAWVTLCYYMDVAKTGLLKYVCDLRHRSDALTANTGVVLAYLNNNPKYIVTFHYQSYLATSNDPNIYGLYKYLSSTYLGVTPDVVNVLFDREGMLYTAVIHFDTCTELKSGRIVTSPLPRDLVQ